MFEAGQPLGPLMWSSLLSMAIAQFLKPWLDLLVRRPWRWQRAFDTGGMPSSHTSLVTTLTLGVGAVEGTGTTVFAVSKRPSSGSALGFAVTGWLYFVLTFSGVFGVREHLLTERVSGWLCQLVHEESGAFHSDGDQLFFVYAINSFFR